MVFSDAFVYSVVKPDIIVKAKFDFEIVGGILGYICLHCSEA